MQSYFWVRRERERERETTVGGVKRFGGGERCGVKGS